MTDFVVATTGVYRLAITRDWGQSCEGTGTYRLMITSDTAFSGFTQTVDDTESLATGVGCPSTSYDMVHTWTCAFLETCQDVYDILFVAGASVQFSATETTGGSVLHIALYAPSVALGGTNLFTGTTRELRCNYVSGCGNNTAGQTVTGFVIPTTGTYRFAVTRDWGTSCGGTGTYRMAIMSNIAFLGVLLTGLTSCHRHRASSAPRDRCRRTR